MSIAFPFPRIVRGTTRNLPLDTSNTYVLSNGGGAGFGFDHNGPVVDAGEPKNDDGISTVNTGWYIHDAAYHCAAAQTNLADPGQIPGDNGWDALTVVTGTKLRVSVPVDAVPGVYIAYRNTNIGGPNNTFTYYWIVFEVTEFPDPPQTPTITATPLLVSNAATIHLDLV